VRGSIGQTGPGAATFDVDAVGDGVRGDGVRGDGVRGDGVGVLAVLPVVPPVGDVGIAVGFVVVVVKRPEVCGGWLVLCVQDVTPRPKTTGARTITMSRPLERFMIVPL
jgi:hypothetical protein